MAANDETRMKERAEKKSFVRRDGGRVFVRGGRGGVCRAVGKEKNKRRRRFFFVGELFGV
jgi:hypothetical protein